MHGQDQLCLCIIYGLSFYQPIDILGGNAMWERKNPQMFTNDNFSQTFLCISKEKSEKIRSIVERPDPKEL
jgi:hypothetical protein